MYNTQFCGQFGYNSMPTATQPYGYSINNMPNYIQPTQQQPTTSTNKIFVSGIEDVKGRYLPANSDMMFLDNDKPILYVKTVDNKGQFEVKSYSITEIQPDTATKRDDAIDLSAYATTSDLEALKEDIKSLKAQVTKYNRLGELINGTKSTTTTTSGEQG